VQTNVLIVGAGPGGCMTANRLAKSVRDKILGGQLALALHKQFKNQ